MIEAPTTPPTATTQRIGSRSSLDFAPGRHFGDRYQIVEEIGRGGMGVVYKAIDRELDRVVALKMIRPELSSDPKMVEQFKRELTLASEISHEHVIRIHDLGETGGIKYISMKYIDGSSLRDLIRTTGRLTTEKAIGIAEQVCMALAAAHKQGVIHRDLKPENIMLDRKGNVYVMDFGIARSLGAAEVTAKGMIIGSPHCMSPEQAQGRTADTRSDIYSLGCILYEMVTGRKVFDADTVEALIHKHVSEAPASPSDLNPRIPRSLEAVVLKCLEKDPARRYASAAELKDALGAIEVGISASTSRQNQVARPPETEREASIAVLPFRDMSPQKDQEYFCDGMAEEIINALVKVEGLRVAALTSAFQFKDRGQDIRKIGEQLNVRTVLEGSVRKAGNRLRVTAQLVNVSDGYHVWSDRYDRDMEDVFAIQDEISAAIVDALRLKLVDKGGRRPSRPATTDHEAYNLYLKGRYHWNKRTTTGINRGLEFFKQAIERDPTYALAYAGIADSYLMKEDIQPMDAYAKARAAALKAIELDSSLAEPHASLALVALSNDYDWAAAERELKRAIELNPSYATAHQWYAIYLLCVSRVDEAMAEIRRARELDPLSLIINVAVAFLTYLTRRYDDALIECRKVLDMDSSFPVAHMPLAFIYEQKGERDKAVAEYEKLFSYEGQEETAKAIREAYAASGYEAAMREMVKQMLSRMGSGRPPLGFIAHVLAQIGDTDEAIACAEKAYEERTQEIYTLAVDPAFDPIRSDPRFQDVVRRIGLKT
jgi:serine/threonine protein kinase/tetratricopeptide (TPR) repeat protein